MNKYNRINGTSFSFFCIFIALFICATIPLFASDDLENKIDDYLQPYLETGNFSGAIVVAKNGAVAFNKAYGFANFEFDIPNTIDTKYPLGSIGKQIAAVAILQLVDQGKIRLDDSISSFIPKFRHGKKVTVHHLLSQTSGIEELLDSAVFTVSGLRNEMTRDERIAAMNKHKLLFTPGMRYYYTNINFWLLTEILKTIVGEDYMGYIETHVFMPAGMTNTVVDKGNIIKKRAEGYFWSNIDLMKSSYVEKSSAGAFFTTAEDLYKFNQAIVTGKLIRPETRDKMFTLHSDVYGYAFYVNETKQGKMVWHDGYSVGYRAMVLHHMGLGITLTLFSNVYNTPLHKIVKDVMAITAGYEVEKPKSHKHLALSSIPVDQILGSYRDADGTKISITKDGENLYLEVEDFNALFGMNIRSRMVLFPEDIDKFFIMDEPIEIIFPKNNDQHAHTLQLIREGRIRELKRVDD